MPHEDQRAARHGEIPWWPSYHQPGESNGESSDQLVWGTPHLVDVIEQYRTLDGHKNSRHSALVNYSGATGCNWEFIAVHFLNVLCSLVGEYWRKSSKQKPISIFIIFILCFKRKFCDVLHAAWQMYPQVYQTQRCPSAGSSCRERCCGSTGGCHQEDRRVGGHRGTAAVDDTIFRHWFRLHRHPRWFHQKISASLAASFTPDSPDSRPPSMIDHRTNP